MENTIANIPGVDAPATVKEEQSSGHQEFIGAMGVSEEGKMVKTVAD